MFSIDVKTSSHEELVDITERIEKLIPAGFGDGICQLFCLHTTAGLTVNENCDPDVRHDILRKLDNMIPWHSPEFRHSEGNSAAHLKASLMGLSLALPVREGKLLLGRWQGVYLCEFDGARTRTISVQFIQDNINS